MSFIDDGIGMNEEDISNSFLKISGNKRKNKNYLNMSRTIMGRKGSGRIGLFAIANNIDVFSKKIVLIV